MKKEKKMKGFTLLELLIVIAILAILSAVLILILNPAETMKKSRDSQRMSDLATMKTAIGMYMTTVTPVNLTNDTPTANARCINGGGTKSVFYSLTGVTGLVATSGINATAVASSDTNINGAGWLPVNFTGISGGSPISNLPVDPLNTVSALDAVVNADYVYRYVCDADDSTFEINATLESTAFTSDDDKRASDGGDHAEMYEVGTKLTILGAQPDF